MRGVAALGRLVAAGPADPDGLVRRHGPGVAAVCRRHLRQPADVDDAVQATFLVLARRAGAVRTAVGPWLYRVAGRTAARLRRSLRPAAPLPDLPARPGLPADVRAVLADELARLPEPYRLAVELCYMAGHTAAEAADRLGWPRGTVLTRLAWARKRLRANLSRRGVTLGGSLAAVLADQTLARGGRLRAGGESGRAVTLCEGAMRAMTLTKLLWAAGLATLAAGGLGAGAWAVGQGPGGRTPATIKAAPPMLPPPVPATAPEVPVVLPAGPEPTRPFPEPPRILPEPPPPEMHSLPPVVLRTVPPASPGKYFTVPHPAGSFVREFADGERFALRFDADRLTVEASFGDKAKPATLTLDADYALNKEGVVFGVVTGAEYDGPDLDNHWRRVLADLPGEPFALRVRADEGILTVKEVRLGGAGRGLIHVNDERVPLHTVLGGVYGRYAATTEPVAVARKAGKPKLPKPQVDNMPGSIPPVEVPGAENIPVPSVAPAPPPGRTSS